MGDYDEGRSRANRSFRSKIRLCQPYGAILAGANLSGSSLAGADLTDADLTGSLVTRAVFNCSNSAAISKNDLYRPTTIR